MTEDTDARHSRRTFIQGIVAAGAAASSSALAHGISGNLRHCQDYDKILTAMMRGAELMRG